MPEPQGESGGLLPNKNFIIKLDPPKCTFLHSEVQIFSFVNLKVMKITQGNVKKIVNYTKCVGGLTYFTMSKVASNKHKILMTSQYLHVDLGCRFLLTSFCQSK